MTCPDWNRLVADRDAAPLSGSITGPSADAAPETRDRSDAWTRAMAHLDGCATCAPRALAADPTLVFRRLPAPEVGAADVEAMRRAVESMRRAGRVAPGLSAAPERRRSAAAMRRLRLPSAPGGWRQLAAAAALAAASFGLWLSAPDETDPVRGTSSAVVAPSARELAAEPAFLELSEPRAADVYQVGEEDLLVVMVMDETLDV